MAGNEIIGKEELKEIQNIFDKSNGVLFAHGFEKRRNNIFRTKIFEKKFSQKLGSKFSVCCSSGTAAGTLALMALGIGKGDEVILQSFTFIAAIESILMTGATPIIVDTDETLGMCPKDLQKKITKKTKCIMPVHMLGKSCNMDEIKKISKINKIPIVEDACEALGVKYKKKSLGTIGEIGFFSFDFGKIITTGEGGMLTTNSKDLFIKLKALRDHGHENKINIHRGLDKAICRGFNFRMTEMQAAVGIAQLDKLKKILLLKKRNFKLIEKILIRKNLIKLRKTHKNSTDQHDFLCLQFENNSIAKKNYQKFLKHKIPVGILPVAKRWHFAGDWSHIWNNDNKYKKRYKKLWPNSKKILNQTISIPISIKLSEKDAQILGNKIKKLLKI